MRRMTGQIFAALSLRRGEFIKLMDKQDIVFPVLLIPGMSSGMLAICK